MCSLLLTHPSAHTWSSGQLTLWRPLSSLEVRCLVQGSHLSRGQFLPEPRFKPTTSGYKSDALSIRASTAPIAHLHAHRPHLALDLTAVRRLNRLEWANAHIRWHLAL